MAGSDNESPPYENGHADVAQHETYTECAEPADISDSPWQYRVLLRAMGRLLKVEQALRAPDAPQRPLSNLEVEALAELDRHLYGRRTTDFSVMQDAMLCSPSIH